MRKYLVIALFALVTCVLTSCKTREERVIQRLNALSEKIEKHGARWDADQWADALEEMEDIHYDIEGCEFSKEQLENLGKVEGRLTATILNEGSKALNGSMSDFIEGAGAYMKGFMQGIDNNYDPSRIEDLRESIDIQLIELGKEIVNE